MSLPPSSPSWPGLIPSLAVCLGGAIGAICYYILVERSFDANVIWRFIVSSLSVTVCVLFAAGYANAVYAVLLKALRPSPNSEAGKPGTGISFLALPPMLWWNSPGGAAISEVRRAYGLMFLLWLIGPVLLWADYLSELRSPAIRLEGEITFLGTGAAHWIVLSPGAFAWIISLLLVIGGLGELDRKQHGQPDAKLSDYKLYLPCILAAASVAVAGFSAFDRFSIDLEHFFDYFMAMGR